MSNELTPKELNNISYRWSWHRSLAWNYEKMMSLGYLATLVPFIEKNYKNDEEGRMRAYEIHSQFFNSCPNLSNLIIGIDLAVESKLGKEGLDTVAAMKNSLMGPFAGVGDALVVITNVIFGSIAVAMAADANPAGWLLWLVWNFVLMFVLRPLLVRVGYKQGLELVTTLSDKLKQLTDAASIMGLMVVGGLVASIIAMKFGTINFYGTELDMQVRIFDSIMPKLGNALITAFCYFLLGKKGISAVKLIWIVMILVIVLSFAGILVTP